jgi:hypothetical protein
MAFWAKRLPNVQEKNIRKKTAELRILDMRTPKPAVE